MRNDDAFDQFSFSWIEWEERVHDGHCHTRFLRSVPLSWSGLVSEVNSIRPWKSRQCTFPICVACCLAGHPFKSVDFAESIAMEDPHS
jgi:hypothetical protein